MFCVYIFIIMYISYFSLYILSLLLLTYQKWEQRLHRYVAA